MKAQTQTRGIQDIANTITPVSQAIEIAIKRLREDPKIFKEAVSRAKDGLGVIVKGSKIIAAGAEDLLMAAYLLKQATLNLFSTDRSISEPIGENYIVDVETAEMYVAQHMQR
jgi:hypothetical protein